MLLGLHPVTAGRVKRGVTVRVGYLSQEVGELPGEMRLLESVTEIARVVNLGGRDLTAGQLCERFGFGTQQQWTFVRELSGGERRRLQLLRLLMTEPNVLVLDEPTNDLDLDTLQAVEDLLDEWPGTLLLVSHDRYFVERVCDLVVAMLGDAAVTQMVGGIDEYLSSADRSRCGGCGTASRATGDRPMPLSNACSARNCSGWNGCWNRWTASSGR